MGVNESYQYADSLGKGNAGGHGRLDGDIITGAGIIGLMHWAGNRKRKKMGQPQEPMSNKLAFPMAVGLGYVFWWVPFLVYMVLATYVIHIHLIALLFTVAIFGAAWHFWKKRRNKKYAAYYADRNAKAWQTTTQERTNDHAFGSDDWVGQATKNLKEALKL